MAKAGAKSTSRPEVDKLNMKERFDLPDFDIILPDETYRGLSYSDLIKDWWNWIFSPDPDYSQEYSIRFLRGNIGAAYKSTQQHIGRLQVITDPTLILNRTGLLGITISTKTALFFPVYDSQFVVGDLLEGKKIETTLECRLAARRDFELLSCAWATYSKADSSGTNRMQKLIQGNKNLSDWYAESSPFGLVVSDRSKFRTIYDGDTLEPDNYQAVAVGIYLLIEFKKSGLYRFDFGGISKLNYITRAVYDVNVVDVGNQFQIKDASDRVIDFPFPPMSESSSV